MSGVYIKDLKGDIVEKDFIEPEINPCRGCEDYDGRGGCKSNGGCAGYNAIEAETIIPADYGEDKP